jgi:hypothetical protein
MGFGLCTGLVASIHTRVSENDNHDLPTTFPGVLRLFGPGVIHSLCPSINNLGILSLDFKGSREQE